MPAFLTHWRILIETARNSQDAGNDLGSLILDASALRRRAHGWSSPPQTTPAGAVWDTGPLPEMTLRFPGSDISAMAFLGALAPDMLYYHRRFLHDTLSDASLHTTQDRLLLTSRPPHWSELFHRRHSGDFLLLLLEQVALVPAPALRSQALAFAMGYVSHIAADIALSPWMNALASRFRIRLVRGALHSCEFLLDEYLAETYFRYPRYHLFHQPWRGYIEPVARNLSQPGTPTTPLLQLLASATEVYQPDERQAEAFAEDFLAGLRGLRQFLAGHGRARWLTLRAGQRKMPAEQIRALFDGPPEEREKPSLTQMLDYATRLSVHLCRSAINYYSALRNTSAEASERSTRRAALVKDLRNWNLHTGYDTSPQSNSADPEQLHNWLHFRDLWAQEILDQEQIARLLGQTG